ncbi:hypothetical protein CWO92_23650 [Heyndrickxia camelliae]|uniref:Uncharacterized protein n=1 Tax=Heyndrickxia camelliae TaxID=1707093 RepID=A0A2N3LD87_9BACI|nr:hypothetical protein CWO92_23650 [Heyndrickxia camelliae]
MRKKSEYAVYKGDSFICLGTMEECATYLGVKVSSIKFYSSRAYKRRGTKNKDPNHLIVFKIDDD